MVTSLARELAGKSTTDGVVIEVNLPEHAYQKQTIIQHQRNLHNAGMKGVHEQAVSPRSARCYYGEKTNGALTMTIPPPYASQAREVFKSKLKAWLLRKAWPKFPSMMMSACFHSAGSLKPSVKTNSVSPLSPESPSRARL